MPDLCLTCEHFVGKLPAMGQSTRLTQPSTPPGSVNELHGLRGLRGWRPLHGRPELSMVYGRRSKFVGAGLAYGPLCLWHKSAAAAAVCGLWHYI